MFRLLENFDLQQFLINKMYPLPLKGLNELHYQPNTNQDQLWRNLTYKKTRYA